MNAFITKNATGAAKRMNKPYSKTPQVVYVLPNNDPYNIYVGQYFRQMITSRDASGATPSIFRRMKGDVLDPRPNSAS